MKKYVLERVFDFGFAFFGSRGPGVQVAGVVQASFLGSGVALRCVLTAQF